VPLASPMLTVFAVAYGAVFGAEIIADKLLYTTGVLATRFPKRSIIIGLLAASMVKMGVATLIGEAITGLPMRLAAVVTTISFMWLASVLWRSAHAAPEAESERRGPHAVAVSFAAVLFSEWGDVGQITAATVAAKLGLPVVVWLGAVAAVATKGMLAATVGAKLRVWIGNRLPAPTLRYCSVTILIALGLLSAFEALNAG